MKQGNPTKKFGRVAMLMALIGGMFNSTGKEKAEAMREKNGLILNVGGPYPRRVLNQRQKRKRAKHVGPY